MSNLENKENIALKPIQYHANSTNMINVEEAMNVNTSITHVKTFNKENVPTMTTVSSGMPRVNQPDRCNKPVENID